MKTLAMLFAAVTAVVLPAAAQGVSQPYSPGITRDAVSYWLPKTRLTVTVHASKTSYTPGEFARYAERYLRMNGVNVTASESWEITGVEIQTAGIPDKDRLYTLAFPPRGERPYFQLTSDGVIWAVNMHPQPETYASDPGPASDSKKKQKDPHDYLTEEILMAGSTSKMAEMTAKEIYSIRESHNAITRGQADYVPADGESLKFLLEQLSEQEAALLTLFTGSTVTQESTYTITVDPQGPVSGQILFRFSSILGVLPTDNLAGSPVWMDIADISSLPQKTEETQTKKNQEPFLYYRIPGTARIKIYNNRTSFYDNELQISQMGNIEVVSSTIMGKHADTQILFDTGTGNISSIK